MRKLSSFTVNWIIVLIIIGLLVAAGISIYQNRMEPGDGQLQAFAIKEKIIIELREVIAKMVR